MQLSRTAARDFSNVSVLPALLIKEGRYSAKNLTTHSEKVKAQRLRHRVFCNELGWVSENCDGLETDHYDGNSVPIGVIDEQKNLKAFLRIIQSEHTFMLEKEFSNLLDPEYQIRKHNDTAEISRLCVEPEARNERFSGNFGVHSITMVLYKSVYRFCLNNKVRFLYLVVEEKVCRLLCAKGFPCKIIGAPRVMPDGVVAVAAILDWREFEKSNLTKRPKMLSWFRQYQSSLPTTRLQRRVSGSRHQVSSLHCRYEI
jgi:acyl homoserine lactone synthase